MALGKTRQIILGLAPEEAILKLANEIEIVGKKWKIKLESNQQSLSLKK